MSAVTLEGVTGTNCRPNSTAVCSKTEWVYDEVGNLITEKIPTGAGGTQVLVTRTYTYDKVQRLKTRTDELNRTWIMDISWWKPRAAENAEKPRTRTARASLGAQGPCYLGSTRHRHPETFPSGGSLRARRCRDSAVHCKHAYRSGGSQPSLRFCNYICLDKFVFPYSPAELPAPPVYEFRIYHLLRVDDPSEPFRTTWESL